MATLEIDFHCLCMFVPDPDNKTVHVLMPASHHHDHGRHHDRGGVAGEDAGGGVTGNERREEEGGFGATALDESPAQGARQRAGAGGEGDFFDDPQAGGDDPVAFGLVQAPGPAGGNPAGAASRKHVVRIMDATRPGRGTPMEGWMLVLGDKPGEAATDLPSAPNGPELVNVSELSGRPVPRALIVDDDEAEAEAEVKGVASRVVLRAGRVVDAEAEAKWDIGGREAVDMVSMLTWRIDDFQGGLKWVRRGAAGDPPLSLEDLGPENGVFRIAIFHVTENALPPQRGNLPAAEVKLHYKLFYEMLGHANPTDAQLPKERPTVAAAFVEDCPGSRGTLGG